MSDNETVFRFKSEIEHKSQVESLRKQVIQSKKLIVFKRGVATSTRSSDYKSNYTELDVTCLDSIISIDVENCIAWVQSNVTYHQLASVTVPQFGLMPMVCPEFKQITIGGSVQGLGIESTSHQFGCVHNVCQEYEIIDGKGQILLLNENKNSDLFEFMPGSMGTMAILTSVKIRLMFVTSNIHVRYLRLSSDFEDVKRLCSKVCYDGSPIIFFDGNIHKDHTVIMLGCLESQAQDGDAQPQSMLEKIFGKSNGLPIYGEWPWSVLYYQHVQQVGLEEQGNGKISNHEHIEKVLGDFCDNIVHEELHPTLDYLFRWDRGAFWLTPYSIRTSLFWRTSLTFAGLLSTKSLFKRALGMSLKEREEKVFVQDLDMDIDKCGKFIETVRQKLNIYPIWICPVKSIGKSFGNGKMEHDGLVLNIGIYGKVRVPGYDAKVENREFENFLISSGGMKGLYGVVYWTEEEFWEIYNKQIYDFIRQKYHANGKLLNVYDKLKVSSNW